MLHLKSLGLIGALAISIQLCGAFEFQDCDPDLGSAGKMISARVSACPEAEGERCELKRGRRTNFRAKFKPVDVIEEGVLSIRFKLYQWIVGACVQGLECPTPLGREQEVNRTVALYNDMTPGRDDVFMELFDHNNIRVFCIKFPAVVI